jgi:hypothetical protein
MSWWKIIKGKEAREVKSLRKALKKKWNGNLEIKVEPKGKNKGGHHKLRVTDTVSGLDIYPIVISASPKSRGKHDLKMRDIKNKFKKEHKFDLDKEYPRKKKKGKKE